jgi:FtsP/CotA-like multicopper oxidase with cupredoxin domain
MVPKGGEATQAPAHNVRMSDSHRGQSATLTFINGTTMWHPMHLHGHTFLVLRSGGSPGPRKDTVIVMPQLTVAVKLVADNPGIWMLHCHNGYTWEPDDDQSQLSRLTHAVQALDGKENSP